jgi:hypothetical protein
VHDGDRADLLFGEFVAALEVVESLSCGCRWRDENPPAPSPGVDRGEKLIYFFLGKYFSHSLSPAAGSHLDYVKLLEQNFTHFGIDEQVRVQLFLYLQFQPFLVFRLQLRGVFMLKKFRMKSFSS